ncbi:MAG: hypothetical protein WC805_03485 [Patescibacteria group bacterium]|jgi:hypothetical protein
MSTETFSNPDLSEINSSENIGDLGGGTETEVSPEEVITETENQPGQEPVGPTEGIKKEEIPSTESEADIQRKIDEATTELNLAFSEKESQGLNPDKTKSEEILSLEELLSDEELVTIGKQFIKLFESLTLQELQSMIETGLNSKGEEVRNPATGERLTPEMTKTLAKTFQQLLFVWLRFIFELITGLPQGNQQEETTKEPYHPANQTPEATASIEPLEETEKLGDTKIIPSTEDTGK